MRVFIALLIFIISILIFLYYFTYIFIDYLYKYAYNYLINTISRLSYHSITTDKQDYKTVPEYQNGMTNFNQQKSPLDVEIRKGFTTGETIMTQTIPKIQQLTIGQQVICLAFGGEVCTIEPTGIFWQGEVWDSTQEHHIKFDLHTGKTKDADFMPVVFPADAHFAKAVELLTQAYEAVI